MQLMPDTASKLGSGDSFSRRSEHQWGHCYLNDLLVRYHDNLALARRPTTRALPRSINITAFRLTAKTRLYVARIIHDFITARRKPPPTPQRWSLRSDHRLRGN